MALTLPHDIVFVPLDVLTAEELNNVMADIQFLAQQFPLSASNIADGAISTNKLAARAATIAKISFTGFSESATKTGLDKFTPTSEWSDYVVATDTIYVAEPGEYKFDAHAPFVSSNNGDAEFKIRLTTTTDSREITSYSPNSLTVGSWMDTIMVGSNGRVGLSFIYKGPVASQLRWGDTNYTLVRIG